MTDAVLNMSRWVSLTIAGITLGAIYFSVQGLSQTGQWWLLVLPFVFVGLTVLLAFNKLESWRQGTLAAMLVLSELMTLFVNSHLNMLIVVVCLLAVEMLSKRMAIVWLCICVLAGFSSELIGEIERFSLQDAVVNSLLTLFFGGFAFLRLEADTGRRKTQQLLQELEEKNQQLASYTAEREQQSRVEERQRLSRELHDTLGHKLTTSIVQLEAAEKFFERDPDRVKNILTTARNLLKDGLDETRDIVRLLDQYEAKEQSIVDAITSLAGAFQSATELSLSLHIECEDAAIPAYCKQHLLRIVQEALTNISRHADASEVHISLTAGDVITLKIEDNGVRLNDSLGDTLSPAKSIESRVTELKGGIQFFREETMTKLFIEIPIRVSREEKIGGDSAH